MKSHYTSLWLLLAVAFAVFAVASAFEMPAIAGHQLKSSEIADHLFADNAVEMPAEEPPMLADSVEELPVTVFPAPCDSSAQTILFIGDSMLEGLGPRMAAYAEENGHSLYYVIWYSSTSAVWGQSDKLKKYIQRLNPSYVFICLGANELFVNDIAKKRNHFVKKIISDIDTIPFIWIGPPNWKPDTGINDLIKANAPEGSFFLSSGLTFERSKDGAHPTRSSASAWMDSVAAWMPRNARHPILMKRPQAEEGRAKRIFVHQPDER